MIIGQYTSKITQNRRLAIPKSIREKLGENLIIAKWYEGCLVLVSEDNWQALLQRLTGQNNMVTQSVRDTDRFILGSAYELTTDNQGRLIMPPKLMDFAGIKDEVTFLGLGDRVEIWDTNIWEKKEAEVAAIAAELVENIASASWRKKDTNV